MEFSLHMKCEKPSRKEVAFKVSKETKNKKHQYYDDESNEEEFFL